MRPAVRPGTAGIGGCGAVRRLASVLVVLGVLFWGRLPAHGHIIPGTVTLQQLTGAADVIASAKITNPVVVLEFEKPLLRRSVVDAEIVEVLRGDVKRGPVRFVPHTHGGAEYAPGEEVLLFLQNIERNREFAGTPLAGAVRYAGIEDPGDHITLSNTSREAFKRAVRDYMAAMSSGDAAATQGAVGRVTLKLLGSSEPKLAASALRDLVLSGSAPLITQADVPALDALIGDPARSMGLRVGILIELDRRKLVDATPRWVRLLKEARAVDVADVARGAKSQHDPEITRELVRWLDSEDSQAAAAAAEALGSPDREVAVEPLVRAAGTGSARLRRAALAGLGKIGSAGARAALKQIAASHADADTRRWARTELNLLGEPPVAPPRAPDVPPPSPSLLRTYWKAWVLLVIASVVTLGAVLNRWARRK